MSKNELQTALTTIDYNTILEHYLERKFWSKRWVLYDYGSLKIEFGICSIDTINNRINCDLNVYYHGDKRHRYDQKSYMYIYRYGDNISIPIEHDEYNNEILANKIYGVAQRYIGKIEEYLIEGLAVYKAEEQRLRDLRETAERTAKKYLDENNIELEDVREAYIEHFKEKMSDDSHLYEIKEEFDKRILTKELLLWASFNNKKEDVDEYSGLLKKKKVSKSTISVWLRKQQDEKIEWSTMLEEI